jgi:hypothetical protein
MTLPGISPQLDSWQTRFPTLRAYQKILTVKDPASTLERTAKYAMWAFTLLTGVVTIPLTLFIFDGVYYGLFPNIKKTPEPQQKSETLISTSSPLDDKTASTPLPQKDKKWTALRNILIAAAGVFGAGVLWHFYLRQPQASGINLNENSKNLTNQSPLWEGHLRALSEPPIPILNENVPLQNKQNVSLFNNSIAWTLPLVLGIGTAIWNRLSSSNNLSSQSSQLDEEKTFNLGSISGSVPNGPDSNSREPFLSNNLSSQSSQLDEEETFSRGNISGSVPDGPDSNSREPFLSNNLSSQSSQLDEEKTFSRGNISGSVPAELNLNSREPFLSNNLSSQSSQLDEEKTFNLGSISDSVPAEPDSNSREPSLSNNLSSQSSQAVHALIEDCKDVYKNFMKTNGTRVYPASPAHPDKTYLYTTEKAPNTDAGNNNLDALTIKQLQSTLTDICLGLNESLPVELVYGDRYRVPISISSIKEGFEKITPDSGLLILDTETHKVHFLLDKTTAGKIINKIKEIIDERKNNAQNQNPKK